MVTVATSDGTFEVATPVSGSASGDRWVFRIGGWAIAGAILGLIGNPIHPVTAGPGHPAATARVVAGSQICVLVHLGLVVAFIPMLGGLIAIRDSLVTPLDTITCITMLNRKSAGRRAGGSTRRSGERSRVVSGRGGGVEARAARVCQAASWRVSFLPDSHSSSAMS
jgi:hypothetical protein